MIVVDTNILAYMVFKNSQSETIFKLREKDSSWQAPLLWRSEFLNVISLYYRKKLINQDEAREAIDFARRLVAQHEHEVAPQSVLELILGSTCSSYDCEFVALAKNLNVRLVTYDKQLLKEFPNIAIKPEDYLTQPE